MSGQLSWLVRQQVQKYKWAMYKLQDQAPVCHSITCPLGAYMIQDHLGIVYSTVSSMQLSHRPCISLF